MANTVKISSCELINADCLEFIRSLPENSVDLIVTDPPYFKVKPEGWDNQWKGDDDYLKWLDQCLAQFWRVLKPAGSLYLFCGHRLASDIEIMMRERFSVLNHIIWAKPSGRWNGCNKESLRAYFPPQSAFCSRNIIRAVSSERCRVYGEGQYGCVGQGLHIAKNCFRISLITRGSCWYHAVVVVRHSPRARRGHSASPRGPVRIRLAGEWVSRYIRICFSARRQHCRKTRKTFCWRYAGCRGIRYDECQLRPAASSISCNGTAVPC